MSLELLDIYNVKMIILRVGILNLREHSFLRLEIYNLRIHISNLRLHISISRVDIHNVRLSITILRVYIHILSNILVH